MGYLFNVYSRVNKSHHHYKPGKMGQVCLLEGFLLDYTECRWSYRPHNPFRRRLRTVSYTITLSGSNIVLTGAAAATQNLASNVTVFTIQTYDESNAALPASPSGAQIDTIRRIQITMTASTGGMTETLRTKFFVRCMALGTGAS